MISFTSTRLLLVEGPDEVKFFTKLQLQLGLNIDSLQVIDCEGRDKISKLIDLLPISPGFAKLRAIGIVRDADEDRTATFTSICACLDNNKLSKPNKSLEIMLPSSKNHPISVGVMIMPGGIGGKMLEDLCLAAFVDDPILKCVEAYFQCHGVISHNPSKAKFTTFLAAKINESGTVGLQKAVEKDWWPWDHSAFDEVKQFVRMLAEA